MLLHLVIILINKYIFCSFIGTSERTHGFGTFPGNYVTPVWPSTFYQPTATATNGMLTLPQQMQFFFFFTIPALLHFLHPPQSSIWFRRACVHCLQLLEWKWRQEHGVVSHLIPPACVHCACVCVTATWVYSHTPFERVGWMLMILF